MQTASIMKVVVLDGMTMGMIDGICMIDGDCMITGRGGSCVGPVLVPLVHDVHL
jgi:hypothetical protein